MTTSAPEPAAEPEADVEATGVLPFRTTRPRIDPSAWVAPGAVVVGDVHLGADSSVWYATVLRADVHHIRVGARTNLQDGCVVHVTRDRFPALIGDEVTVGHRAVVHGCTLEDGSLVGIGAVVLDGARVGEEALVAAGALVPPGMQVPPRAVVMGVPARVVRKLDARECADQRERAIAYVGTARAHRDSQEVRP